MLAHKTVKSILKCACLSYPHFLYAGDFILLQDAVCCCKKHMICICVESMRVPCKLSCNSGMVMNFKDLYWWLRSYISNVCLIWVGHVNQWHHIAHGLSFCARRTLAWDVRTIIEALWVLLCSCSVMHGNVTSAWIPLCWWCYFTGHKCTFSADKINLY